MGVVVSFRGCVANPEESTVGGMGGRRALVLYSGFSRGGNDFFIRATRQRGYDADLSIRPVKSRVLRAVRRVHMYSRLPFKKVWFGEWVNQDYPVDLVVVHASDITLPAAEYAAKRYPNAQVVFWFWNPVGRGLNPDLARSSALECWSFDQIDCARYGLSWNSQFMFSEIREIAGASHTDVDFGFYGADKGRAELLSSLADHLTSAGMSFRFSVVPDGSEDLSRFPRLISAPAVGYESLLEECAKFRVIVDFVQDGQSGMTLRILEALYMGRKVLTNLASIASCSLYDRSRVFIWGVDSVVDLPEFLRCEYQDPAPALLKYFDFESWLARFYGGRP